MTSLQHKTIIQRWICSAVILLFVTLLVGSGAANGQFTAELDFESLNIGETFFVKGTAPDIDTLYVYGQDSDTSLVYLSEGDRMDDGLWVAELGGMSFYSRYHEAGTYLLYVSPIQGATSLADLNTNYVTVNLVLTSTPFSMYQKGYTYVPGTPVDFFVVAEGISEIRYYLIGEDSFIQDSLTLTNGLGDLTIDTTSLNPGSYWLIVQTSGTDNEYNMTINEEEKVFITNETKTNEEVLDLTTIESAEEKVNLIYYINSESFIDDVLSGQSLSLTKPELEIYGREWKLEQGMSYHIAGYTNVGDGKTIRIEISPIFGSSSIADTTTATQQHWEYLIDTSNLELGEYTVTVSVNGVTATETLEIIEPFRHVDTYNLQPAENKHYLGEDITITGMKGGGETFFFYIEGECTSFTPLYSPLSTTGDEEWSHTIDCSDFTKYLEEGWYQIYMSKIPNAETLYDLGLHGVISVYLQHPSVSVINTENIAVKGYPYTINGVAENTDKVRYYLIGENYFEQGEEIVTNGAFTISKTMDLSPGEYTLILHHPMDDEIFNVAVGDDEPHILCHVPEEGQLFPIAYLNYDAELLENHIVGISDEYTKFTITVQEPKNIIAENKDVSVYCGEDVTISGYSTIEKIYAYIVDRTGNVEKLPVGDSTSNEIIVTENSWRAVISGDFFKNNGIDSYTIYLSTEETDTPLNDAVERIQLTVKAPHIALTFAQREIANGCAYTISGFAPATDEIRYYLFGDNLFEQKVVEVKDNTFTITKEIGDTAGSHYIFVIQHPMYDKVFNIQVEDTEPYPVYTYDSTGSQSGDALFEISQRQYLDAAYGLEQEMNERWLDDVYVLKDFTVQQSTIMGISLPYEIWKGDAVQISGRTNLDEGKSVTIEMMSTSFPSSENEEELPETGYISKIVKTTKGGEFECSIDTFGLAIGTYKIRVSISDDESGMVEKEIEVVAAPQPPVEQPMEPPVESDNPSIQFIGLPANNVIDLNNYVPGKITAVFLDKDGNIVPDKVVTISSANPEILRIDEDGTYTPLAEGSTTILAKVDGVIQPGIGIMIVDHKTPIDPDIDGDVIKESGKTTITLPAGMYFEIGGYGKTAILHADAVTITITFKEVVGLLGELRNSITGEIESVHVSYDTFFVEPAVDAGNFIACFLSLMMDEFTFDLPVIDSSLNNTAIGLMKQYPGIGNYETLATFTVTANDIVSLNNNITENGIEIGFVIPKASISLDGIKIFHIKSDGTIEEVTDNSFSYPDTDYYYVMAKGSSFSTYVVMGEKTGNGNPDVNPGNPDALPETPPSSSISSQGSSTWLQNPQMPTETPSVNPTEPGQEATDTPTPTQSETESPGFGLYAVLLGLVFVGLMKRK